MRDKKPRCRYEHISYYPPLPEEVARALLVRLYRNVPPQEMIRLFGLEESEPPKGAPDAAATQAKPSGSSEGR
jgi:hypothetical protein